LPDLDRMLRDGTRQLALVEPSALSFAVNLPALENRGMAVVLDTDQFDERDRAADLREAMRVAGVPANGTQLPGRVARHRA